jgi:hypothetical protein
MIGNHYRISPEEYFFDAVLFGLLYLALTYIVNHWLSEAPDWLEVGLLVALLTSAGMGVLFGFMFLINLISLALRH